MGDKDFFFEKQKIWWDKTFKIQDKMFQNIGLSTKQYFWKYYMTLSTENTWPFQRLDFLKLKTFDRALW